MELEPTIEARALDETETYLREFVQVSLNCGIKRVQMVLMLRKVALDIEPKLVHSGPDTPQ
jgi:hypothetical protein